MPADPREHADYQRRNEADMAELRAIVDRARARLEAQGFVLDARGKVIERPTLTLIRGGRDDAS